MINDQIAPKHIKPVLDWAGVSGLDLSTVNYSAGDYMHSNVLTFNVFPKTSDCGIKITKVIVRESISSGTLAKNAFKLLLFNTNDFTVTKNSAFSWSDGTSTINDLCEVITVLAADYIEIGSNNAIAIKNLTTPIYVHNKGLGRELYGICKIDDTDGYDATADLDIELVYEAM